tara:strand:- start:31 stop:474 length:444 start_codon:yes stop_codon:yes gene_type:complete
MSLTQEAIKEPRSNKRMEKKLAKIAADQESMKSWINKHTNSLIRKGGIAIANNLDDAIYNRVGKVLEIVEREGSGHPLGVRYYEKIAVFKLHYNGQLYMVPLTHLRKATNEEKRADPRASNYWRNSQQSINLSKVFWVERPTTYSFY